MCIYYIAVALNVNTAMNLRTGRRCILHRSVVLYYVLKLLMPNVCLLKERRNDDVYQAIEVKFWIFSGFCDVLMTLKRVDRGLNTDC